MDTLKELIEQARLFIVALDTKMGELKEAQKKAETAVLNAANRELAVDVRTADLNEREKTVSLIEDIVALRDSAEKLMAQALEKEAKNKAWYDTALADIADKEKSQKAIQLRLDQDLAELKIKQADLLRDSKQLQEERTQFKRKISVFGRV